MSSAWAAIVGLLPHLMTFCESANRNALAAAGLLAFALLSLLIVPLLRWLGASERNKADSIVMTATGVGGFLLLLVSLLSADFVGLWVVAVIACCLATLGLLREVNGFAAEIGGPSCADAHEPTSLFDRVLGQTGLAPVQRQGEDELYRAALVDELFQIISIPRAQSLNFGVEGQWGSGKTSVLNMLKERLEEDGFTVVRFDLWSYREPERLIRSYFDRLAGVIEREAPHLQVRSVMRRLAAGLIALSGTRSSLAVSALVGDFSAEPLEDTRKDLGSELESLERPIVVFLDDLDRLDRDELTAVLRSVRLMSDLPKVAQVLAYDREMLSRVLFPGEGGLSMARDYLAKLVNYELSIASPPQEVAEQFLELALGRLLRFTQVSPQEFRAAMRTVPRGALTRALATPREALRVVAATAARWQQMAGHVNLFDLLILVLLQYRAPDVYKYILLHPQRFAVAEWSVRFHVLEREPAAKGKAYLDELESQSASGAVAAQLLTILFPHLGDGYQLRDEEVDRRGRRATHPDIIERYFHLYVPPYVVTESEIETWGQELTHAAAGESRQERLNHLIASLAEQGRLDSFLDQWLLVFGQDPERQQYDSVLVYDLSLGLARAAACYSHTPRFLFGAQYQVAIGRLVRLSLHLGAAERTTLLRTVVDRAANLAFAGGLVEFCDPEK